MYRSLLFALFAGCLFASAAVSIQFEGFVPHGLDTSRLEKEYIRICSTVGLSPEKNRDPLVVCFYRYSENRKTGIRLPEWGGGGALGRDSIVIPVDRPSAFYREDIERILLHEMVHIALARAWGPLRVPRWFHEGMAMTLSGELNLEEQLILSRAILTHTLVPLDSMERLNRFNRWRAQVAYCQSHFAVRFLLDTYGFDVIPELLETARRNRRFDLACLEVFGLTQKEFEALVRKEMVSRYRLLFIFGDYSFFWLGILLLAFVAFIVTRIRNRKKRQRMEEVERREQSADSGEEISLQTGEFGT
jgi:hypothetical protein